jgi:hypothetical protein
MARHDVVEREVVGLPAAVLARVAVTLNTSRRDSFTRGRGRRTMCWRRMTDGARYSTRGVRTIWWSNSITSAFSPKSNRKARGRLQTLSGS